MYTFEDRDGTSLTLRPENTASVIRAYIEHRLDQRPGVQKLYYMGPMFRRERPQKGRYRQFFQIGAEAIGSESPLVDAEVIEMVVELLRRRRPRAGSSCCINSVGDANCRPQYVERLREELEGRGAAACAAIASAAPKPIRCACSIAKWRPTSPSSSSCRPSSITCATPAARTSTPCSSTWTTAASRTKCARGWCAASITTCAPRSRWCTARWARRTRCWAAAATTAWPNRWARRSQRPGSASPSAKTAW